MSLQKITHKQQQILTLLYRFRFLNRIQIQSFLKHKYPKRINDWLKDLTQKEYIGKIYSNKLGENTKPAIYYLSINSIKYLRTIEFPADHLKKLYREKERSGNFINKYLILADICLELQGKSNNKIKFAAATGSDLADPDYKYNFLSKLGLDLVFVKESKEMKKYFLLEIFELTLPLYSIRKRIRSYIDFYFSNSWEDNTKENFPTLIIICPTIPLLIYTKRYAKKLKGECDDIELHIKFTTEKEVKENGITSEISDEV